MDFINTYLPKNIFVMSKIKFTIREIQNAWINNYQVYKQVQSCKNNGHRLILFYAVECGLKTIVMKRENKTVTDSSITEFGHNINKMLDHLRCSSDLKLPIQIQLNPLQDDEQRKCSIDDLNQMWRYGHCFKNQSRNTENDNTLENKLIKISEWISKELSGI
jgi:hypothetical protein